MRSTRSSSRPAGPLRGAGTSRGGFRPRLECWSMSCRDRSRRMWWRIAKRSSKSPTSASAVDLEGEVSSRARASTPKGSPANRPRAPMPVPPSTVPIATPSRLTSTDPSTMRCTAGTGSPSAQQHAPLGEEALAGHVGEDREVGRRQGAHGRELLEDEQALERREACADRRRTASQAWASRPSPSARRLRARSPPGSGRSRSAPCAWTRGGAGSARGPARPRGRRATQRSDSLEPSRMRAEQGLVATGVGT